MVKWAGESRALALGRRGEGRNATPESPDCKLQTLKAGYTECESTLELRGTTTSINICYGTTRMHVIASQR